LCPSTLNDPVVLTQPVDLRRENFSITFGCCGQEIVEEPFIINQESPRCAIVRDDVLRNGFVIAQYNTTVKMANIYFTDSRSLGLDSVDNKAEFITNPNTAVIDPSLSFHNCIFEGMSNVLQLNFQISEVGENSTIFQSRNSTFMGSGAVGDYDSFAAINFNHRSRNSRSFLIDISDSLFINNTSSNPGAAIQFVADRIVGEMLIQSSLFSGNKQISPSTGGSAISTSTLRSLTINSGTRFEGNDSNGVGGALVSSASSIMIEESFFQGNSAAEHGGAIALFDASTINIIRSTFTDNQISGIAVIIPGQFNFFNGEGGAIFIRHNTDIPDTKVEIQNCEFESNSATAFSFAEGGALKVEDINEPSSSIEVRGCIFRGNRLSLNSISPITSPRLEGGAIYFENCASALIIIGQNTVFEGNVASSGGGAIYSSFTTLKVNPNTLPFGTNIPDNIREYP